MTRRWDDEPQRIENGTEAFAWKHGGVLTRYLLLYAKSRGYLDGEFVTVDVRCTYQEAGETQHVRDTWHFDNAERSWVYVDGPGPTEVKFAAFGDRIEPVPTRTLFPYHGMEHRCPRQPKAGWRYFFRIMHCDSSCGVPKVIQ